MEDRWGPDPTYQLWERWRRPVLVGVAVVLVANQWDRLSSGQPLVVLTGAGVAGFWISLIFVRSVPALAHRTEAEAWRRSARRGLVVFGVWSVVALGWLILVALLYSVRPANFVVPAIPTLLTASQGWTYRRADRLAELQRLMAADGAQS